ncbi:MAG TPA: hypothetical protein VJO35_14425 [Terriglobales bacterium]|nr:hypothetical protein [Terriglobales bacterium]
MKYVFSALLSILLLLPVAALARDTNSRSVDIPDTVIVAGHQLTPGPYKVEWMQAGPQVKVNFVRNGKTVASAPATLKSNDTKVTQNDVVTRTTNSNTRRLMEIDFGHQKEALLFVRRSQS